MWSKRRRMKSLERMSEGGRGRYQGIRVKKTKGKREEVSRKSEVTKVK